MTIRELLYKLKDVPDTAEIYLPEHDMPGWRDLYNVKVLPVDFGHCGPYVSERKEAPKGVFLS